MAVVPKSLSPANDLSRSHTKILILLNQGTVSATSFVTTLIVGNACGPEALGLFAIGLSIVFLAMAIESSLVSTPYTVFVADTRSDRVVYRNGSTLLNLLLVTLSTAAGFGLVAIITGWTTETVYETLYPAIVVAAPMLASRYFVRRFLLANHRVTQVFIVDLLSSAIQVGALLAMAQTESLTPVRALLVVGLSNLACSIYFFSGNINQFKLRISRAKVELLRDWRFGKWLIGEQTLTIMSTYGAPWLLAILLNSEAVGIFAACFSITGLANPFLLAMGNYLLPRFSAEYAPESNSNSQEQKRANGLRIYWQFMGLTFSIMSVVAIACIVWAEPLISLFYHEESFRGHGDVLIILAIRSLIGAMGLTAHFALIARRRPQISLIASVASVGLLVIFSFLLIPAYGLRGGALAWSIATVAESLTMIFAFHLIDRAEKAAAV